MNYEHVVESQANFDVWDISGSPLLRKKWTLYIKNVPAAGIIYVVNVSEDVERIRESKKEFLKVVNEPALFDCIVAVVFNVKPSITNATPQNAGEEAKRDITDAAKKDEWIESPFNIEHLDAIFGLAKLKKSIIKSSFLIDVGEQKACEKVFQWISGRLEARLKARNKRERLLAKEAIGLKEI
jgi:GTPase SAR1 family protein